ncbi:MAG: three-Cys-motif partner protein TcmP [Pseudolabrys sp.]
MPKKHYSWKIGEPLPEIGSHSLAKHQVFDRYIGRYIEIVAPHPAQRSLNLTIVDGFCGGGRYSHTEGTIAGSPLILLRSVQAAEAALALQRQHGFKVNADFFFVDKQKEHIDFLMAELHDSEFKDALDRSIHLKWNSFENEASSIIDFIKRKGTSHRSLFFLDQYGWSAVSFETIRKIFEALRHPEVLLTFSIDSLIDYFREATASTKAGLAIDLDQRFASQLVDLKSERGARYLIQNYLYQHILHNTGARFYTPFFIRSADNHRSYWLLHLSTRERARDEMARLHWDMSNTFVHYGKAGFNALGYDPDIDPDQHSLEFDFGSNARSDSLNAAVEQLPGLIRDDGAGEPVTIAELFRARCNDTPLTMPLVSDAVIKLRDEFEEVDILTPEGKLRPKARNLKWTDLVRPRKQRTFYRGFGSPRKGK